MAPGCFCPSRFRLGVVERVDDGRNTRTSERTMDCWEMGVPILPRRVRKTIVVMLRLEEDKLDHVMPMSKTQSERDDCSRVICPTARPGGGYELRPRPTNSPTLSPAIDDVLFVLTTPPLASAISLYIQKSNRGCNAEYPAKVTHCHTGV